jgi:hypothetical protein
MMSSARLKEGYHKTLPCPTSKISLTLGNSAWPQVEGWVGRRYFLGSIPTVTKSCITLPVSCMCKYNFDDLNFHYKDRVQKKLVLFIFLIQLNLSIK